MVTNRSCENNFSHQGLVVRPENEVDTGNKAASPESNIDCIAQYNDRNFTWKQEASFIVGVTASSVRLLTTFQGAQLKYLCHRCSATANKTKLIIRQNVLEEELNPEINLPRPPLQKNLKYFKVKVFNCIYLTILKIIVNFEVYLGVTGKIVDNIRSGALAASSMLTLFESSYTHIIQ